MSPAEVGDILIEIDGLKVNQELLDQRGAAGTSFAILKSNIGNAPPKVFRGTDVPPISSTAIAVGLLIIGTVFALTSFFVFSGHPLASSSCTIFAPHRDGDWICHLSRLRSLVSLAVPVGTVGRCLGGSTLRDVLLLVPIKARIKQVDLSSCAVRDACRCPGEMSGLSVQRKCQ